MKDAGASHFYETFRERLRAIRVEKLDISQGKMATALGIPESSYAKYETRDKFPLHLIERLSIVSQEEIEFLLTGKNQRPARLKVVR